MTRHVLIVLCKHALVILLRYQTNSAIWTKLIKNEKYEKKIIQKTNSNKYMEIVMSYCREGTGNGRRLPGVDTDGTFDPAESSI